MNLNMRDYLCIYTYVHISWSQRPRKYNILQKDSHKTAAKISIVSLTRCSRFSHVRNPRAFVAVPLLPPVISTVMVGVFVSAVVDSLLLKNTGAAFRC